MTPQESATLRADLAFIANWVKQGAHVLDVGCGDGAMLAHLQAAKHCTGYGIEIEDDRVLASTKNGINVIQHDMNSGLGLFPDGAFDTVLCLSALQMMENVEGVLKDIARVGGEAIVSFPNFAFWTHRLSLLCGRMPVSKSLPYEWYDTPNLRCATIGDFSELANHVGLRVLDCVALKDGKPVHFLPNLRGSLAVFRLGK